MNGHAYRLRVQASGQDRHPAKALTLRSTFEHGRSGTVSTAELGEIYRRYASDLAGYARRWGFTSEDAEDFTQDFFLRLEKKGSLASFDRRKGKFRSFLLTLFQRFLANQCHSLRALRRGGMVYALPLGAASEADNALIDWKTPETMAHLRWARLLVEHALEKLRKDLVRQGKVRLFDALLPILLYKSAGVSHASLARQVGLSDAATRMKVSRYRERLRVLICRELQDNGSGNEHTPAEVRDFLDMFSH